MNIERFARERGQLTRQYDYDDQRVVAVDLGAVGEASAEVVGDTVIVVAGDEQYDLSVPGDADAQAFIKNGVLTIELEDA